PRIWVDIRGRIRTVFVLSGGVLSTEFMPDTEEVTGSIPVSPTRYRCRSEARNPNWGRASWLVWCPESHKYPARRIRTHLKGCPRMPCPGRAGSQADGRSGPS